MRVIFEDHPASPLVQFYASVYKGITVLGVGGVENILGELSEEPTIAYVDICVDSPRTRMAFNKLVRSNFPVIPVPIPNMEYMYLLLMQRYGQVVHTDLVQSALSVVGYEQFNHFHARNYEKFCKAVTRSALTGCARLGRAGSRFITTDCICGTPVSNCSVEAPVRAKALEFVREFPIKWFTEELGSTHKTKEHAIRIVNSCVDSWNIILQRPYLLHIPEGRD